MNWRGKAVPSILGKLRLLVSVQDIVWVDTLCIGGWIIDL